MLARLFAVDGRPIVPVLVLGRDELGDFDEGDRVGRTPDIDARDCINLRKSTPFSLTSCPCTSRLDMSIVVLDGAMGETCCGSAGTGGGAGRGADEHNEQHEKREKRRLTEHLVAAEYSAG